MGKLDFSISKVEDPEDVEATSQLFEAYSQSLGIDLSSQDFATEMATMPGKYSPPGGVLLLARNDAREAIGCVGLRPTATAGYCEMKRFYVDPKGRGLGVGKALAGEAIQEAKRLGYRAIRLNTLMNMVSARALYKALGFIEIPAYYVSRLEGTIYLELVLEGQG